MNKILLAWIGATDLRAAETNEFLGPIGQAVDVQQYERVVLLSNYPAKANSSYKNWIRTRCQGKVSIRTHKLSGPTNFGEIYEAAVKTVEEVLDGQKSRPSLTFHVSPGTPAMAAVWIILAKTKFPATLIESSRDHGVKAISLPFDISAEYLPDLLRKSDEELMRLSLGLTGEAPEFDEIVHRCDAMKRIIAKARKVAPRDIPVLILGESGTGKELLARAIKHSSLRKAGPFVTVNCGAIPSSLVDAELFGYKKGAFTGADKDRTGHIEKANGGTLFLDEIGELPSDVQVRLLRVLQEGEVVRIGTTDPVKVNFRLIAATNRNLQAEIAAGRFRSDLFYRIAVAILNLPPLRNRPGDLGLLIDSILDTINKDNQNQPGFERKKLSPSAKNLLLQHPWPGNVRELQNTLQRAAVWSTGSTIDKGDAQDALLPIPEDEQQVLGRSIGNDFDIRKLIREVERHYLTRAMKEAGDVKVEAAKLLGLRSYQTLTNWLKRDGAD